MKRTAEIHRQTGETDISLTLDLDGSGAADVQTGVGFLDHMLTLFARHGLMDLQVRCVGDLHVDQHHTVEDVGICLGMAILKAAGDKRGIVRYGTFTVPMDESLVMVSLDLSGRAYMVCNLETRGRFIGAFDAELVPEFFQAVAGNALMNLHVHQFYGQNGHHLVEAAFKAFGRALDAATRHDERVSGVPSTKGVL
ncbi:MAG: imidazoleglycerol-phosphate dehydratase [Armatimonadetes bacterium]|jgi:imidazoleglycerol-phosphate dehydratase|nr:imidazoleglycerol-phosphate dehydratase [Armatimonadota bacterium]